ncbi:CBS domain-containing protein [Kistimonas scapharcae]|uniref:CBS domain-containing protein n=1 Tax=Kistimonas scapharcae TaxID=1036133 RepID=A0ABP8V4S1_9GAMM
MIPAIKVKDYMQTSIAPVSPDATLSQVLDAFMHHDSAALPVSNATGQLLGVITEQSVLERAMLASYHCDLNLQAMDIMVTPEIMVSSETDILMLATTLKHQPETTTFAVVDNGRVSGIIRRKDILKALAVGTAACNRH